MAKFNWGHGITLFFIGFAGFMVFLVVKSFQQNIDLVEEDYYAKEVAYGDRMEQISNANSLEERPTVVLTGSALVVTFPASVPSPEGTLHLYRPADKQFDTKTAIALTNHQQALDMTGMPTGLYRLKIEWTSQGKSYFVEEAIYHQ